jgi:hypothetical protein
MRKCFDDQLGEIGFGGSGCAEAGAVASGAEDGVKDPGIGVAKNERAPGADIVYVLVAVGVPDSGAQSAKEERGVALDGLKRADGGVDAAGD